MNQFFNNGCGRFKHQLVLVLLIALAGGCAPEKPSAEPATTGKIIIRGSNTVGEELAPRLMAEYKQANPTAEFDLEAKGTSYGMGALMGGYCDIAGASRLPTKEELEVAQFRKVELNDYVIGSFAVAIVVNSGNAVANLTREQVRDIFTGTIQNWKEVGGADAPIHLYLRDPISGTYQGFKEMVMENKSYPPDPQTFTLMTNYLSIIQSVASNPNGIGFSGMNLTKEAGIKALSIGGVEASAATVNQGQYPFARKLHLYTGKGKETPGTISFIEFIQSKRGQEVVALTGNVPSH